MRSEAVQVILVAQSVDEGRFVDEGQRCHRVKPQKGSEDESERHVSARRSSWGPWGLTHPFGTRQRPIYGILVLIDGMALFPT